MEKFNISRNHIRQFQHDLFEHLEKLSTQDLSNNELSDITSYLHSLTNLVNLRIDHNKIPLLDAKQLELELISSFVVIL